jgi:hypothetical protein
MKDESSQAQGSGETSDQPRAEELSEGDLERTVGGANAVEYGLITAFKPELPTKTTK